MIPDELIEKFLQQQCTPDERDQLAAYFEANPAAMDRLLSKSEWDQAPSLPPERPLSDSMLSEIRRHATGRPATRIPFPRWAAAAAVLLVVAAGAWLALLHPKEKLAQAGPASSAPSTTQWTTACNHSGKDSTLTLPDGSTTVLSAGSTIRYKTSLPTRDIYLSGDAFFDVAKDAEKAFKVYSGALTTTVLGTTFSIRQKLSGVTIRLYTGRIEVSNGKKGLLLKPGDIAQYNTRDGQIALNSSGRRPAGTTASAAPEPGISEINGELVFDNVPFGEVIGRLQKKYNVPIQYDRSTTSDIYFSGTVSPTDSLPVVLKAIARMNGLELSEQEGTYSIRKPKK